MNVLSWQQMRGFWKDIPLMGRTREQVAEIAFENLGSDRDAWSNEILLSFNDSQRTAVFVSVGPDGTKGTPDDVICLVKGLREWDTDRDQVMFNYCKSWQVPEGLQDLAKPFVGTVGKGEISSSKVVTN